MMNLAEYRRTASRLADYLPWVALIGEGVVLNKDGSFQRTAKFRGPDLDSAVAAELVAVAGRLNNAFRRLGSSWAIFVEAQRTEAATYPDSTFPDTASALVDAERKADFQEEASHFVSGYFLTFLWLPPAEDAARSESWLYEGRESSGVNPWELVRGFIDRTDRVLALLDGFTRAILMDKVDATRLLTRIRRQWFAKRKSIAAILKEVMTNEQSALVDSDAANKAADADMALQELGADMAGMAYVTATVTVWDEDARRADEKLRLVEKIIQSRDFSVMVETVNAVDAWLGSMPGHAYANLRQPPVSTLNLAHMVPSSAVWAGPERDDHFGAPPLLYGRTEGSTPFRFSLHVGDVGHTLVVGPTGAGKSVLLALMTLQFRRYPRSQVFAFDFGGSIRAASLAMGGDWHDLGGELTDASETSVSLQPLARIHETAERAWAADWIVAILMRENIQITPEVKEHIWTALTSLASAPVGERTITGLAVLLQSNDLKQALRAYCVGGPYGRLLDAESEHLGSADVQAFEIEGLVGTGAAPAVLSYLFHRIGDRLDGRPTLLIIDEGWLALDDDAFAEQLREWLKTLRKKNASVIFATQSLSDIDNSAIAPAIIESCPTRLLLPNERAIEPQITAIYRRFGLNDRQIEILARATLKRDYYCQSRRGNRLFELGLSEVGLALCAASAKSDQALIAEIFAEHGRDGFLAAWLRARGVDWAADLIPDLTNLAVESEDLPPLVVDENEFGITLEEEEITP
ncbi:MAG: conjugal transfer protein TrbE [Geminicoccaceae bacterium]